MGRPGITEDEPVTPASRLFLSQEMGQIINCAIGLQNPIDINAIKLEMAKSLMFKHPRFSSLLVLDPKGRQRWRKTQINLDDHIFVHHHYTTVTAPDTTATGNTESAEDTINDYLSYFISSPLSTEKPLWEVHVINDLNCLIWRVHHALGDGISLMSMLLECCRKYDDASQVPAMGVRRKGDDSGKKSRGRNWREKGLWAVLKSIWFTLIYVLEFVGRSLWVKDKKTVISGGAGVELWPRKLATAKFRLADMKTVKRAIPGVATPQEGLRLTGLAMVNLRKQPGLQEMSNLMNGDPKVRWGNKFGFVLLPVYYHKATVEDPLSFVKRAKAMIDRKKQSWEAYFSYAIGDFVMKCFGPKNVIISASARQEGLRLTGLAMVNLRKQPDYRELSNDRPEEAILEAYFSYAIGDFVMKCFWPKTINDVLFGVISSGLSRYLENRSAEAPQEGLRLTGLAMVNLRKQPGLQEMSNLMNGDPKVRWGNKFGFVLLPVYYHKATVEDPLSFVKRAKAMIDRKKQSWEAYFSYAIGDFVMKCFGPKVCTMANYRIVCNTTFVISNVIGPQEEITMAGNPVTYMRAAVSGLPHAILMHMVSYKGKADMQIQVAKDIIPDPEFLAECFEDALLQMKVAAEGNATKLQEEP
ncbi:hypothetical protein Nepgr_004711 [Nepenthes gracilis]|uniref:Diacylglycerol O-acyltransferase n=1 Tax=Nepenthes gracilis TaxID=150966 RepID=A0AAD3S209_NEPGR|nr:hypothetical protein Nepgr_004711 [Nepenthes gracilis]